MATFGTVLPSDSDVLDGYINGLREANSGFLEALVRYSSRFNHFIFFCGEGDISLRQDSWNSWLKEQGVLGKTITVFPLQFLSANLASSSCDFFYSGDPYISHVLELRDAFSEKLFPVVGRAHALSQDISLSAWRSIVHSPSLPCDALLCSSKASRQVVENLLAEAGHRVNQKFSGQLVEIPLGVEPCHLSLSQVEARKILGLPENAIILLCLGRLSPVDKCDLHPLHQTLAELYDRHDVENCYLYICGQSSSDDDYVVSLVNLAGQLGIDDRVLFNFDLSTEQKPIAYRAADVFISLADSVQESFGIAPVEAMAAGLPVILSDWDGYRELIEPGRQGELIPTLWGKVDGLSAPGAFYEPQKAHLFQAQTVAVDIPELVSCLNMLIGDSSLRKKMGRSAVERVSSLYLWKAVVEQFDRVAGQLIESVPEQIRKSSGHLHSMHFGKIFSGYATEELSEDDLFQTSFYGRQTLSGVAAPVRYEALDVMVSESLLSQLLRVALITQSQELIREELGVARAQADALVLWALKHGLLVRKNKNVAVPSSERSCSDSLPALLTKSLAPDCLLLGDATALQQSILKVLLIEQKRVLKNLPDDKKSHLKTASLLKRYLLKRLVRNAKDFRILSKRLSANVDAVSKCFSINERSIVLIEPLTDQLYSGSCRVLFQSGEHLVYKPASSGMAESVNRKGGLFEKFNQWCGEPVFSFGATIYLDSDQNGDFSFRLYQEDLGFSPAQHLHDLGLFSAFALCSGMSDLHLDNVKVCEGGLLPVDLDMFCHPDVLGRLYDEVSKAQLPCRWEDSSLALTRIEILWDELLELGWMLEKEDVETVIEGFETGLHQICANSGEWHQLMIPLTKMLCRDDPVPYNSALPVIGQLETYDLAAVGNIKELTQDLTVQARRMLKQLGLSRGDHMLVSELVKSWQSGKHYSGWVKPGDGVANKIVELERAMNDQPEPAISWLTTLYREWLMERSGLTDDQ